LGAGAVVAKKKTAKKSLNTQPVKKQPTAKKVAKKKRAATAKSGPTRKKVARKKASKKKASKKKSVKKKKATARKAVARKTPANKAKKSAAKRRRGPSPRIDLSAPLVADGEGWIDADGGYALSVRNGKLVCRNKKGKILSSVPRKLKDSELGEQLAAMAAWLKGRHDQCAEQVQTWMLRSLPVPLSVAVEIWPDPDWRSSLENVVVVPVGKAGKSRMANVGILRDVDSHKGLGVIDEDGETGWIKTAQFAIPHPVLLDNVDELRELLVDLNFKQPVEQLFRDVYQAEPRESAKSAIARFAEGEFEQLNYALSACRTLGYQVSGGAAICNVWENGEPVEARYWIGSDYPEGQTWTGDLTFVDKDQRIVKVGDVGPVALSEGIRMASAIFAKRKVPKETEPTV